MWSTFDNQPTNITTNIYIIRLNPLKHTDYIYGQTDWCKQLGYKDLMHREL